MSDARIRLDKRDDEFSKFVPTGAVFQGIEKIQQAQEFNGTQTQYRVGYVRRK
ncbi:MAG: hypothetical protein WBE37_05170 [Bryobacteraceae bacterium]